MLGIETPLLAYNFDRALHLYGSHVDGLFDQKKWVWDDRDKSEGHYERVYTLDQALRKAAGEDVQVEYQSLSRLMKISGDTDIMM